MSDGDEDDPRKEKYPLPQQQLQRVWLTVILMLTGGCVSAIVLTLLISWAFGLKIHLP